MGDIYRWVLSALADAGVHPQLPQGTERAFRSGAHHAFGSPVSSEVRIYKVFLQL